MKKQVVVFIHGVGKQSAGYSHKCSEKIQVAFKRLLKRKDSSVEAPDLVFREVFWADITGTPQAELWKRVNKSEDLDMVKLRKFMVAFAGDAIAYQKTGYGDEVYIKVDACVRSTIDAVYKEHGKNVELTIVAHSLGTIIASNFLYDHRKAGPGKVVATNFFTMGSPLAIWSLSYGDPANADKPVEVKRPEGAWINILDDEDIIGYPLRDLNKQYKAAVDFDYVTEIGRLTSMGNPLSHTGYWEDDNVVKPIAYKLMLDCLRLAKKKPYSKQAYIKYIKSLWNI